MLALLGTAAAFVRNFDDEPKVAFDLEIPAGWPIYAAGKKPLFGQKTVF